GSRGRPRPAIPASLVFSGRSVLPARDALRAGNRPAHLELQAHSRRPHGNRSGGLPGLHVSRDGADDSGRRLRTHGKLRLVEQRAISTRLAGPLAGLPPALIHSVLAEYFPHYRLTNWPEMTAQTTVTSEDDFHLSQVENRTYRQQENAMRRAII